MTRDMGACIVYEVFRGQKNGPSFGQLGKNEDHKCVWGDFFEKKCKIRSFVRFQIQGQMKFPPN